MNIFTKFVSYLKLAWYKLTPSKKIILANQDAIKKMEELNNAFIKTRLDAIESSLLQLIELEKMNQELLVHLCTTNEELLNTISEGEITFVSAAEDEEDEFVDSQWNQQKKDSILN